MNILFVTPFFNPQSGGVATYVQDIKRLLGARGHSIYVLRPGDSDTVEACPLAMEDGVLQLYLRPPWISTVPVRAVAAFLLYFVPTMWRLYRFVRRNNIQVISLEYPMTYMVYFYLIRAWTGIPIVVGLHGSDVLLLHTNDVVCQWIVRRIIRRANWILAHSASLVRDAHEKIGKLSHNHSFLHYGVECKRLRDAAESAAAIAPIPDGDFILTVAKLYPRKGLDVLLRAIQVLKSSGAQCRYRFVIAGDGPEESRLKSMTSELGIESMVLFAGDVKNDIVPALFERCAFFALSSRVEPFGIVLLEAMTFGKAIVATTAGGIPEFVQDGHNGLLVPIEDSQALAAAIDKLIRNKDLRDKIGGNGRMIVEEQYDYDKLVVQYEELFKEQVRRSHVC
ncbi:glycosyltransferase family 4 protein [Nitrospira sp. Nam80]